MIGIGGRPITRPCADNAAGRARQAGSHPQVSQHLQGIELNRLRPAHNQCLMQLAAFDIKAGHVGARRDTTTAQSYSLVRLSSRFADMNSHQLTGVAGTRRGGRLSESRSDNERCQGQGGQKRLHDTSPPTPLVKETAFSCRLFGPEPKRSCNARLGRHERNSPPPATQTFNTSSKYNTYP